MLSIEEGLRMPSCPHCGITGMLEGHKCTPLSTAANVGRVVALDNKPPDKVFVAGVHGAKARIESIEAPVNPDPPTRRILIGTPTLGTVRIEWHNAMAGIVIPCNWSNSSNTPINYLVHDAQNIIAHEALRNGFDWVLLLEDDVLPPPDLFLRLNKHMEDKTAPIISGLYHLKGQRSEPEPLVYRGRGTGAFKRWKPGELVWADGVPTGCLLIHTSILRELSAASPVYTIRAGGNQIPVKKIFETPREAFLDQGTGAYSKVMGTSDLFLCDRIVKEGILKKAGWPALAAKRYPFVVDTGIRCGHIDRVTGVVY